MGIGAKTDLKQGTLGTQVQSKGNGKHGQGGETNVREVVIELTRPLEDHFVGKLFLREKRSEG